ncbi:MAG: laminin G domain-containing protein [Nocardioidaceae bacterium]
MGSATRSLVRLDFDDAMVTGGRLETHNDGQLALDLRVATAAGGRVDVDPDPGGGQDLRFPPVSTSPTPPRAVLVVTAVAPNGGSDPLSPGRRDFSFGARFRLDTVSTSGTLDNGNNLVQRGLSADPAQYKVQVDHGRVSCRVAGDEGALLARSTDRVSTGEWYAVTCSRVGDSLTLVYRPLRGPAERVVVSGPTGSVTASATTPLAVGGKVTAGGVAVRGNSDQFNGAVDDVFLSVSQP